MNIDVLIQKLKDATKNFTPTLVDSIIKEYGKDPFLVLISCLLSLRAKDSSTIIICRNLFKIAKTPQQILKIPLSKLEKIIFKSGFYKNKAKSILHVCSVLIEKYNGKVPKTSEELLSIKGIGPKTANLILGQAFRIPAICVDTHVHRISNRLGLVKTKTPEQTLEALEKVLPKKYWTHWNNLLVQWGQNVCTPTSPFCSTCKISKYCKKIGVTKHR
jgi:endonuclease III